MTTPLIAIATISKTGANTNTLLNIYSLLSATQITLSEDFEINSQHFAATNVDWLVLGIS